MMICVMLVEFTTLAFFNLYWKVDLKFNHNEIINVSHIFNVVYPVITSSFIIHCLSLLSRPMCLGKSLQFSESHSLSLSFFL